MVLDDLRSMFWASPRRLTGLYCAMTVTRTE